MAKRPNMRRRLIDLASTTIQPRNESWLDLDTVVTVEVTSEDKEFPVEAALSAEQTHGWRAAETGSQTIRLVFDVRQKLKHVSLLFEEKESARTQEFVLRWSSEKGGPLRELVRQQWNFSPPTTTQQLEEYSVALSDVAVVELTIVPDISGGGARASLKSLRLVDECSSIVGERSSPLLLKYRYYTTYALDRRCECNRLISATTTAKENRF
jgi:hypothetical protein